MKFLILFIVLCQSALAQHQRKQIVLAVDYGTDQGFGMSLKEAYPLGMDVVSIDSGEALVSQLKKLKEQTPPLNDTDIIIHFKTHGFQKRGNQKYHDTALSDGPFNLEKIEADLTALAETNKIALLDFSCYSGHTLDFSINEKLKDKLCLITGDSVGQVSYSGFMTSFSDEIKNSEGRTLEELYAKSRGGLMKHAPAINTPTGLALNDEMKIFNKIQSMTGMLDGEKFAEQNSCENFPELLSKSTQKLLDEVGKIVSDTNEMEFYNSFLKKQSDKIIERYYITKQNMSPEIVQILTMPYELTNGEKLNYAELESYYSNEYPLKYERITSILTNSVNDIGIESFVLLSNGMSGNSQLTQSDLDKFFSKAPHLKIFAEEILSMNSRMSKLLEIVKNPAARATFDNQSTNNSDVSNALSNLGGATSFIYKRMYDLKKKSETSPHPCRDIRIP